MKKLLISSAIVAMLGLSAQAQAFNTIGFDINGNAAGGSINVQQFDWLPGNSLGVGALGELGGTTQPGIFTTLYQSSLGVFKYNVGGNDNSSIPGAGTEFTIQAGIIEQQIGVGTGSALFVVTGGWVKMFYDTSKDANTNTGAGFGDGIEILSGTILSGSGAFADFTRANNTPLFIGGPSLCQLAPLTTVGCSPVALDQNLGNGDNKPGVLTHTGNGSSTLNIHVDSQNNDFFKSDLLTMLIGINDTTNLADPFAQTDPSDSVVGVAPSYSLVGGVPINGGDCPKDANGTYSQRCDFHFQSDASSSFNAVPEPASLALVGLGLLGLGSLRRRRDEKQ